MGRIDAAPAAGGFMAIKVQANTGSLYEIMVDPEQQARASRKPLQRSGQDGQKRLLQSPLLLGVKRTSLFRSLMSANDP